VILPLYLCFKSWLASVKAVTAGEFAATEKWAQVNKNRKI